MYLGADLSKMTNLNGQEYWDMSSDNYCTAVVTNVEYVLENRGLRLLPKYVTPLSYGYCPDLDVTRELKVDGFQFYQELIGTLRWAVEICRIDTLL